MNQCSSEEYSEYLSERELILKLIKKGNEGNMRSLYCLTEHCYCNLTKKNCAELIGTISDEKKLAEVAVNAGFNNNSWMTFAAIKCISTPSVLEDVALRFSKEYSGDTYNPAYDFTEEIRFRLLDEITSPSVLIKIHKLDKNEVIRHKCLNKLLSVFKCPSFPAVPDTGLESEPPKERICDYNSASYNEAKEYMLSCYRDGSYNYLEDPEIAPGVIRCDEIYNTVSDDETLKRICLEDELHIVRVQAASMISDSKNLEYIAKHSPDTSCRMIAAAKIADPNLLTEIAVSDDNETVRQIAAKKNLGDSYLLGLVTIAIMGKDKKLRRAAVERIDNEELLTRVVLEGTYHYTSRMAMEKIKDENLIRRIAIECPDVDIRKEAHKRIQ